MTIISYGALLTESSKRNKGERRLRSISPKLRLAALELCKLHYPAHSEMTSVIAALEAKALALNAGTIFTVGNMVRSPDSLSASKLGRLWRAHIEQGTDFKHVGNCLTPSIYERLNTKTGLMNDFTIDLFTFKEYQE